MRWNETKTERKNFSFRPPKGNTVSVCPIYSCLHTAERILYTTLSESQLRSCFILFAKCEYEASAVFVITPCNEVSRTVYSFRPDQQVCQVFISSVNNLGRGVKRELTTLLKNVEMAASNIVYPSGVSFTDVFPCEPSVERAGVHDCIVPDFFFFFFGVFRCNKPALNSCAWAPNCVISEQILPCLWVL